jgi:tRNA threonylcarbamoyladenosine biosynthesis protein TsaB
LHVDPIWAQGARYPQAIHVARLAGRDHSAGASLAPELALPVYLRDKVALTSREQSLAR